MKPSRRACSILLFSGAIFLQQIVAQANGVPHSGLLLDLEVALVNRNAKNTQRLLMPEQQISACSPFDVGSRNALTGSALCTVATPSIVNGTLKVFQGPDLLCSYLVEAFCDVQTQERFFF